ncbi:PREDICTED: probable tRNA (uracil-O(2)-)-methyltransferase [Thamnophis sirtalis]|uniref:tRNA (uracil-O(2)-)-methyltransferase n=1 Tax=Thamnophis sirtalis TaxID=35019 RepID=A0A6I9XBM9_9SAUR|nr:PREDICTED: probable tRNA (uracil-O(2)-)-methyltransferase [Thamnophis sirtalis]
MVAITVATPNNKLSAGRQTDGRGASPRGFWEPSARPGFLLPPCCRSSHYCRYFLLPCCFFDFYGKYNRRQSQKSQYREYLDFVTEVGTVCGFQVEEDCLRIPSTKRVCLIGMSRTSPAARGDPALEAERRAFIRKRQPCHLTGPPDKACPLRREQSPSAAGQLQCPEASRGRDGRTLWPSGFLPRGKEQVRNCTTLPHAFVDQVALKVAHLLLSETGRSLHGPSSPWNSGGESRAPYPNHASAPKILTLGGTGRIRPEEERNKQVESATL